jgi:cytochrome b subunit of formate dehydrogenase
MKMKLSEEARVVLERTLRERRCGPEEAREIEALIAMLPDDRVLLQKNVDSNPIGDLPRYSIHIRIQHLLTFTTFLLLAFTGMPVHYPDAFWARPFNELLGGIEVTRIVHRTLALTMIASMLYHVATLVLGCWLRHREGHLDWKRTVLPQWKDVADFRADVRYFAGKASQRPEMDKFMYKQKIHYFAAGFGNTVMIVSGSAFLFPDLWAAALPSAIAGYFQEMMRLSHPHEALLALLVIAFWHWYNVHLAPGRFPMQWTFLTGRITREHQIEEHFLEYLRCLVELPEERRILAEMLRRRRLSGSPAEGAAPLEQPA